MRTISLEEFHDLLGLAYAVSINDTLYFVGYDTDGDPYTADKDGDDYLDLSSVDGHIQVDGNALFFHVGGQPIRLLILTIKELGPED